MNATFVPKAAHKAFYDGRAELRLQLQTLDGNGFVQANVVATIDDAKAAFAYGAIDTKLAIEDLPPQPIEITHITHRHRSHQTARNEATLIGLTVSASEPLAMDPRTTRLAVAGAVGASVVHELRNALAVVSSSLFLARRDRADETRLLRHLDKAAREVYRAQAVVAAVLGLARGETLTRETTSVAAILEAARGAVVLPTNVTFSITVTPSDLTVLGDPVLLERVLVNLYLNAIEALAGRGRGAIHTRAQKQEDGTVTLIVEDDGPGIEPALAASVFDPLVTTKATGTGLGLALVRAVAEAHGGDVRLEAPPSGHGTRFVVQIPPGLIR